MNSVKLYSNGSAVITKGYRLKGKEPLKVTIPVKKDDLDDVVSSLSVLGDVTLPDPPNYTPTNSNPTTLSLDGKNVLRELATKLRGAEAEIAQGVTISRGRLYGIQTYQQETNGSVFERFRILLGTANGVQQFEEADITSLKFTDEFVQSEIDKSLAASFAAIKPDSRNVDLTIVPNEGAETAAVSYATPCAAWKTRYQIRILKGIATLERQAVVDNDTDDDWREVTLSVITGEPISFSTDIADIRRPTRSRVNVVSDTATSAVIAEDAIVPSGINFQDRRGGQHAVAKSAMRSMAMMPAAAACSFESAQADYCSEGGMESLGGAGSFNNMQVAPVQSAEVRESGDFSVFTAPNPVTILSRKSAIIGLGNLALDDAKTVLLYKPAKNERRPYTAIKFKNTTQSSLSKGVCEVYVDGDRQGKCVLESTKQGEETFLVHAVETGVKAFRDAGNVEYRRIRVKISEGVVYCEQLTTQQTKYRVQNSKGEDFQFEIEHNRQWPGSKLSVSVDEGQQTSVDTPSGCRVSTTLPSNGTLVVTVTENLVQEQQYGVNPYWLQQNLVIVNHPLSRNKSIQGIIEAQQAVDAVQNSINEADEEVATLTEEQERLIALIPNLHAAQANNSKNELAEAEGRIKTLTKTTLPQLRKDLKKANDTVKAALLKLKTDWTDEDAPQAEQGQDK